tara:strand:+ start:3195 stop:3479 length:285 start_codon:yes stop_codon:yes gene_type:complete
LKYRRSRLNSEVIYSGKDLIRFQKTYDKKEEEVKPKKSCEKNVSTNTFGVLKPHIFPYFPAKVSITQPLRRHKPTNNYFTSVQNVRSAAKSTLE